MNPVAHPNRYASSLPEEDQLIHDLNVPFVSCQEGKLFVKGGGCDQYICFLEGRMASGEDQRACEYNRKISDREVPFCSSLT